MASEPARPGSPLPARSDCQSHGYVCKVCESRPLAILVGSSPHWDERLAQVSSTDVHILSYHSDVSVVENGEDNIVEFEMIARDQEWQQIAMAVTIDLSNEHFIRFI